MVRSLLFALAVLAALVAARAAADAAAPKVLRYAFPIAETGFDPAQVTDLYSNTVLAHIFEAPLEYEYLARPARMRANTAAGAARDLGRLHATSCSGSSPGIYFADDPAFKGKRRELTAHDYVYSIKRHYDPRWKSGKLYQLETDADRRPERAAPRSDRGEEAVRLRPRGRRPARARPLHASRSSSASPAPRFHQLFTDRAVTGAVAREVVELYGDRISEHPVGTGPFRLTRVAAQLAHRARAQPGLPRGALRRARAGRRRAARGDRAPGSRAGACRWSIASRSAIIEEPQPRWLSFLNDEHDLRRTHARTTSANRRVPNNKLAPNLAKRGIQMVRYQRADVSLSYFAWSTRWSAATRPTRWRCAARSRWRSTSSARSALARNGQAIPAQSHVAPQVWGYDPAFKSEMSEFDRAKAQRAARPVRLRRPRRRRLARAARRHAADARVRDASPTRRTASSYELWRRT